ncbi:hypothetical protein [Mucilaginibacter polytrichastri]|uniref:Uncharacterized protein n=1 Tax=Mucilaginibacter polytrichastri TaxID=1302689 RepID=A0A1Q5ZZ51_9SPHI|nr:hypothetical protein [Mucilaginibacter polytrichastri]OKS87022.1 hypothetical protein RG47T_2481 [Mucilaginibacter polytrichastri]SFS86069.1 hypothetical protein SAMN04487890_10589 [Mucilaginibacter polytrichastri]
MIKRLLICFLIFVPALIQAQVRPQKSMLTVYQDSLKHLGYKMINNEEDVERKSANYDFIKTLTATLKLPGSFGFKFDSVKTVSIITSPDDRFRIFSWHVMNQDGSYRFYGTIQINTGTAPLEMYPLADYSPFIANPQDTVTDNTHWYGAQYYQIIPVNAANPYYVLLGWKGNTVKSTKKVIEVLSFKNGKPVLGLPVFTDKLGSKNRVVFEYSRQVSMMLKYLPEQHTIIFDHLSPPDKRFKDKPDTFGPDLSYDNYRLQNAVWIFQENIDLRNVADPNDVDIDPKKQARQDGAAARAGHN